MSIPRRSCPRARRRPAICAGLTERGCARRWPAGAPAAVREWDRARARAHRRTQVRAVLSHRARRGPVRPLAEHPLPGPRLGRQFDGVLLPGNHRSGSLAHVDAVRALHLQGAQRASRYRRGLRARAARGGDPVHLSQVRPRARRPGGDRHLLSPAKRASRCRQGARLRGGRSRPAGKRHAMVGWPAHRPRAHPCHGVRSGRSPGSSSHDDECRDPGLSPPSFAARRRLRHRPRPVGRARAHRECRDAGAHRHRVGQGRSGRPGAAQGGCAGTRHAERHPPGVRIDQRLRPHVERRRDRSRSPRCRARMRRCTT